MQHESQHSGGFISKYIERVLAVKALRKIRAIVDEMEAEDRRNRRNLKIIAIVLFVLLLLVVLYVNFGWEQETLSTGAVESAPALTALARIT